MHGLLVLAALLVALPASAVTIEWVSVDAPGNPPDTATNCFATNCGSVPYAYYISKYEVTNAQYAEFLNAKAALDPLALYNTSMGSDANNGGITQSGSAASYTYSVKPGFENKPVNYVSFYDALRFSNWLYNGQGTGDTETGAYTLLGGTATPSNGTTVTRNVGANLGAITFVPSENEWYKAAFYDATSASFFDYPAGSDLSTTCTAPTAAPNSANCDAPGSNADDPDVDRATDVGSFTGSASPYGTFDQGGNVEEWNDLLVGSLGYRSVRGGSWFFSSSGFVASHLNAVPPTTEGSDIGFRVANAVIPEPGTGLLVMAGLLGLAMGRRLFV